MSGRDLQLQRHEPAGLRPEGSAVNVQRLEVNRLIVLVPDQGADGNELARQVWTLAAPCELSVLFVCVPGTDGNRESAARLRMATMASLIRDERVEVSTQVISRTSWVNAVRRLWQPGDMVLCCAEQMVQTFASGRRRLCQVLEFALDVPVFVLTGLYTEPPHLKASGDGIPSRILYWASLAAIMAIFFFVEVQIDQQMAGLARTALMLLAGLVELGVIVVWSARS
jgi:hypothetical protein